MKRQRIKKIRGFLRSFRHLGIVGLALVVIGCGKFGEEPLIAQAPLPYETDALQPYISDQTLRFHYGKHYTGYVNTSNQLLKESVFQGKSVVDIIALTSGKKKYTAIFNNVSQAYNHAFFWKCLKPEGGGSPSGELAKQIKKSFGSFEVFKEEFIDSAGNCFGSGWVWLVLDGEKMKIITTGNADTPVAHGLKPLLTVDVWEHAYYLDYQNRRTEFVEKVLNHLVDWDFAALQLKGAEKSFN